MTVIFKLPAEGEKGDAPLGEIKNSNMRELAGYLRRLSESEPEPMSQTEFLRRAGLSCSLATVNRWKSARGTRYQQDNPRWSSNHDAALAYLKQRFSNGAHVKRDTLGVPALEPHPSPVFDGLVQALGVKPEAVDEVANFFPGDYLVIAFSSSWSRSFTVSALRIAEIKGKRNTRETVVSEIHQNISTSHNELYQGVVYGRTDMTGILSFDPQQGLVRHYIQTERSPRIGEVLWMKGYLVTSGGDRGGFASPFYMERIPTQEFREQHQLAEERAFRKEGPTGFILRHFCDVAPIERIVKSYRALKADVEMKRSSGQAMDKHPSALSFFRRFIRHAEMHFHEADHQMRYSFERLKQPSIDAPWIAANLEEREHTNQSTEGKEDGSALRSATNTRK